MSLPRLFILAFWLSCLATLYTRAAEPTTLAVMPESLHRETASGREKIGRGGVLAEQVRLILGSDDRWAFVERSDLSSLEREHALSAAGALSDDAAIRSGRLNRADWILSIRLLATDVTRPAARIEIFDTLRAERLAIVEAPLAAIPDESWLISPNSEAATSVAAVARTALAEARARTETQKDRVVFAPIGFLNTSRTDRLDPLEAALRNAFAAIEHTRGARLRMLPLDTVADTFDESLLAQAGMADAGSEKGYRFADALIWVEFSELSSPPGTTIPRVKVELTITVRDGPSEIVRVIGSLDALPELASRAATTLTTKIGQPGTGGFSPDARTEFAKRLVTAAKAEGPRAQPWNTPQDKRRFMRAARLIELAAFLAPENREWRELHVWMALQCGIGNPWHAYWSGRYWEMVDHFIHTPNGVVDVGLLARGRPYRVLVPGSTERFLRIGRALGDGMLPHAHELEQFAYNFMNEIQQAPDLPRQIDVFEAMWPALRQALDDPRSYDRRIMEYIYRADPQRGRAFLTREFTPSVTTRIVASLDPWFEFIKPSEPILARTITPPRPGRLAQSARTSPPAFRIPVLTINNNRLVEPPHESIDTLAELQTRFLEFEPFRMAEYPFSYDDRITRVLAENNGLWTIISPNHTLGMGMRPRPMFFDFKHHDASTQTVFGDLDSPASNFAIADDKLWLSTAGQGLRIYDRRTGDLRTVDSTLGLLRDEVLRLEIGGDSAFTDSSPEGGNGEFVTRVPFVAAPVARATLTSASPFDDLPPALRAAIASFGPNPQPRVKLPQTPGKSTWSQPSVPSPNSPTRRTHSLDTSYTTHCRTSVGDGFWISDGTTVGWAAGNQLKVVGRWTSARVQGLADDGRNLFIAVTLREFPNRENGQAPLPPDALRIYIYDHQAAAWRGYFRGGSYFESMSATRGLLAFTAPDTFAGKRTLLLMNTSAISPPSDGQTHADSDRDLFSLIRDGDVPATRTALARGADVNDSTANGWTPLMAALWADQPAMVRVLLDAGARVDAVDNRGWHPLLIAAAWSSPSCLESILATGLSPDFQARDTSVNNPNSRPAPRLTALQAALRSDRSDSVALLLRAGATPDLANMNQPGVNSGARKSAASLLPNRADDPAQLNRQLAQTDLTQREPAYLAAIKPLLAAGADPLWAPPDGEAALFKALKRRFAAAAELMLAHADDLNRPLISTQRSSGSRTIGMALLRTALETKQIAFANQLLDKGLVPTTAADDGDSGNNRPLLLGVAVEKGDARIVRALLASGFRFSSTMNETYASLAVAIKNKDAALLAALLEPVTRKDGRQSIVVSSYIEQRHAFNLLFPAIEAEWEEGIRMLVKAGTRRDAHNDARQTLSQIVRPKPTLTLVFNDRPGSPDNTLEGATAHHAVADGGKTLAASDLTPAVVAYRDYNGETLLMAAARRGDGTLVDRLLSAGADPNAATSAGETALSAGILACDDDTIAALLAAGASPDGAPDSESPPLHVAAFAGNDRRVAQLLAAGASPTLRTPRHGMSPILSSAASPLEFATLRTLIQTNRIDLAVTNNKGLGVLEFAVASDSPEKIQYLLDQGARWQKPLDEDYHPMDVAASNGFTGSLRKLAQLGLHSPRALSLAKDDATRAILLSDNSDEARHARDNETLWPDILRDNDNWRARAEALLADGGNVNHSSKKWGTPLTVALWQDDPEMVRFLLDKGADPVRSQPAFSTSTARTVFFGWMLQLPSRGFVASQRPPKTPEELDAVALAYLELFWKFETHEEARASLLRAAFEARLPRTAERMIALGTSTRSAALSFRETTRLTPEERAFWAALLGVIL